MRLLIIGCGAIGQTLAKAIDTMDEVDLFYMTDKSEEKAQQAVKQYRQGQVHRQHR